MGDVTLGLTIFTLLIFGTAVIIFVSYAMAMIVHYIGKKRGWSGF